MVIEYMQLLGGSLKYPIWFLGILLFTFIVERIIRRILHRFVGKSSKLMQVDPTQYNFMKNSVSAVLYLVGFGVAIYIIPSFRTLAVSLLAGAGILAVVVGLASQQALSNIISGIMIVMFKPFRVGDWISLDAETKGTVEDITLRHTVIVNRENKRIIIPNSVISNEKIENAHIGEEAVCRFVELGISYDANINTAIKIMQQEAAKHKFFLDKRTPAQKKAKEDPVRVEVIGFGDSSVNLRAWVWAKTPDEGFRMHLHLNKRIKERFDKEGVEIPFPYRTIVYKKDISKPRRKR